MNTSKFNARRWKHENGGILKYQNPAITLDLPEGSVYGGELEPAIIKPTPIKAELNTYYPVISKYPWTGHSELILHNAGPQKSSVIITRGGYNSDYNLITNNCSDSTRCAVEQIYNEKINPILFTTPGDVRDFLLKKGVDKIKTGNGVESQYFEIPFATAMELRNKNIDYQIQDYLKKAEDHKKDMEKLAKSHDRKWNSSGFDESVTKIAQELEKRKYKFQPFKNKNGGILKAQGGTGNLYAPHPLSPVGIALNQAKAMAKMKGEQHFPLGVKEVVGPDGNKVAIRTEQPLMPLEQSIAEWMPGTGDVAEARQIANDIKNGNLGTAALAAGLMILPGNARKILDKFGVDLGDISTFKRLSDQEWDDMYFQAIDSGDMDLVQTIRDAHFKIKAPNTKVVDANGNPVRTWHGTEETFTEFNPDYTRRTFPGYPRWTPEMYFTPQREWAERYAGDSGKTLENYLNIEHLDVPSHTRYEDWKVNDGYIFKQAGYTSAQDAPEIIVHNPKNIKSSNSITIDDNRNIIPISKRDNFDSADFRYGFTPIVLGLGAAKAVSNNTKEQQ